MTQHKISRRDAIGMIAKTGMTLGAGTCFFLTLKTSALLGAELKAYSSALKGRKARRLDSPGSVPEKVVISGAQSTILFKISGQPGRHCGIAYATVDSKRRYKAAANSRGVIGKDGLCTISVDVKGLPSGKIYLRVVTGGARDFTTEARGTRAFEVQTSNGVIAGFGGATERPLENVGLAVAAATCGYQARGR